MPGKSASPAKGFARTAKTLSGAALPAVARALRAPRSVPGVLTRAEERALVRAARTGDRAAERRLLEAVSGTLYRFGRTFCRDPHDAEDLRQDVLLKLLESLATFRGESALSTWAFVVARRACAARRRRAARTSSLDAQPALRELADPHASPARDAERHTLRARLEAALHVLPAAQREVVLLRDVEGRSAAEVARALGLNERAVKSRLHRARLALRRSLGDGPPRRAGAGCPETALLVSRYLEGELSAAGCRALEAHVRGCPDCLAECASLRRALGACRTWGAAKAPPRGTTH